MATNLLSFHPSAVRTRAIAGDNRSDQTRRKTSTSSNWWSPLFGWSSEPDYIDTITKPDPQISGRGTKSDPDPNPDSDPKTARPRYSVGSLTEAKARRLRMMTTEIETFHDVMYHSAIASRLASDFGNRSDS